MKKIVRLTETDLTRIVRRVIKENEMYSDFGDLSGDELDSHMRGEM